MSLQEINHAAREWTERDLPWGEAILLSVRRSAPRLPGARFAAATDGSVAGSISAGCVESDLREHVLAAIEEGTPRVVTYGITDEMALGVGLSCGGEIEVLVRPHDTTDPVDPALSEIVETGAAGLLVTGVSEEVRGSRLLVTPGGLAVGGLGRPDLDARLSEDARELMAREGSRLLDLGEGTVVFLDPLLPPRRLVIIGATPTAAALCSMATLSGFSVIVIDPREALARPELYPGAELVRAWPDEALATLDLDPWTSVAVLAHEARLDVPALRAALEAGCRYVGLLGGRRTQNLRRQSLSEAGIADRDLERIRGPIGLDIGAATPAEIAVAVLAELLAVRHGAPTGRQ